MDNYRIYGNPMAEYCILQLQGSHEIEMIEQELNRIRSTYDEAKWCLITVPVNEWDNEMSPWPVSSQPMALAGRTTEAESVHSGIQEHIPGRVFGNGAKDKLEQILQEIIPDFESRYCRDSEQRRRYGLAGYSLAGLFALWASYQTNAFDAVAAMSPSVWYPGWIEYARENECRANKIYLSLGSKEHKTRNKMMGTVADAIREQQEILNRQEKEVVLEWNEGNHFANVLERIGKGIVWMLSSNE